VSGAAGDHTPQRVTTGVNSPKSALKTLACCSAGSSCVGGCRPTSVDPAAETEWLCLCGGGLLRCSAGVTATICKTALRMYYIW
jgi:hypothetical protein